jgi:hypothetical protein
MSFGSVFPSILADFTLPDPDPGSQSNADPEYFKSLGTVTDHVADHACLFGSGLSVPVDVPGAEQHALI